MGTNEEFFGFLHDGEGSRMSITILGSLNSLHKLQSKTIFPITFIGSLSSEPERDSKMVDRGVTTRDRDRERALVRVPRNIDVRFMKSIMNLRDRLKSSYSCNQRECPFIRERLDQHQRCQHPPTQGPSHDPGPPKDGVKGRNMASSPIPTRCVTTGCGPGKKTCTTRALNTKTGKYEDVTTTIELYDDDYADNYDALSKNYADVDTTTNGEGDFPNSDRLTSNTPIKSIDKDDSLNRTEENDLTTPKPKDYSDGYTTTHAADFRTFSDSHYENFDDIPSTSTSNKPNNNKIDRETSATSISSRFGKKDDNTDDRKAPHAYNRFGRMQATRTNDGKEFYTFDPFGRPVRTSTGAYDGKIPYTFDPFGKSGSKPVSSVSTNDEEVPITLNRFNKPEATSTGTYYDEKEQNTSDIFDNIERSTLPTRAYNGKGPITFDTYIKPEKSIGTYEDNGSNKFDRFSNTDRTANSTIDRKESITLDALNKPDTTHRGTDGKRSNTFDRFDNAESTPMNANDGNAHNTYDRFDKPVSTPTGTYDGNAHNTYDRFSKPATTQKAKINGTLKLDNLEEQTEFGRNSEVPFEREVKEWIKELPMYPSLGKQGKEENTNTINNLINNLNYLAPKAADPDYEERVKIETYKCLRKMPIWYPGDKRDQDEYENTLIEKLFEKITKKTSKQADGTNTDTASNSTVTSKRTTRKNSNTSSNKTDSNCTITNKPAAQQNSNTNSNRRVSNGKVPNDEIKNAIIGWLVSVNPRSKDGNGMTNYMPQIADFIIERLRPLLHNPVRTKNRKLVLKTTIQKVLGELPTNAYCSKQRILYLQHFTEDLANRIFIIQSKYVKQNNTNVSTALTYQFGFSDYTQRESTIRYEVEKCFEERNIDCYNTVIDDIGCILMEFIEMPDPEGEVDAKNAITHLLVTSAKLSEVQASITAKILIRNVKNVMREDTVYSNLRSSKTNKPLQRNTISVYSSAEGFGPIYPLASTPISKSDKKTIPKLNPQEIQYMEKVANVVRVWMETLPESFNAPDEQNFKDTMILDLAGDIMDRVKLQQLAPKSRETQLKYLNYIVCRWLHRISDFDLQQLKPQIQDILNKLLAIPVPVLTQPQHGNRQTMANIVHNQGTRWDESFLPKGTDILQDEISIWMNEQPSYLFTEYDQSFRNKKIQEIAQVLEDKLAKKRPETEITSNVKQWLNNIVKPQGKDEIDALTASLKDRVIKLPQDATLVANYEQKIKDYKEYKQECLQAEANPPKNINECTRNETVDEENTMQIFISKYLDHNYDIDDSLARRAFNRLLVTHLQRLDLSERNEVYDKFEKGTNSDGFQPKKFISELEYIKYVSDWLKSLPLDPSFNTPGNYERVDIVNGLATSIQEIEEERYKDPSAMDYNLYIGSIILQSLRELPILKEYHGDQHVNLMIDQLVGKITANRQSVANLVKTNESLHTTGVNVDNIGDFIEEFILINGEDIAHDEVKLEAWAMRLIREIKHIIRNTKGPSNFVMPKVQVYNELIGVPIPGDETAKLFSLELEYVTEISNWLKNLPLLLITKSEEDDRVRMICELAEKMTEMERKSAIDPKNRRVNADFEEYVAKWISDLPLDKKQEIVLPILIQQLIHRMEIVKQKVLPQLNISQSNKPIEGTPKVTKSRKDSKEAHNANSTMIGEIEKWANALPIKSNSKEVTANIKNDVSRKLSQKVGQLNMDPKVYNNDLLFKDTLEDEIDTLLENIPETADLENDNKEILKTNIVDAIMDARNDIKAANTHKLNLENIQNTVTKSDDIKNNKGRDENNSTQNNQFLSKSAIIPKSQSQSLQGGEAQIELFEDAGLENDNEVVEERTCPIERYRRYNEVPYCIIPMRYICKKCDGYNMFWCKIPVPGYF